MREIEILKKQWKDCLTLKDKFGGIMVYLLSLLYLISGVVIRLG